MIRRDEYLKKIIRKQNNGLVKVITGVRRCGKSYFLFNIYRDYLLSNGVSENQIISLALDDMNNNKYRNPFELDKYLRNKIIDNGKTYYIFIDEIQFVKEVDNPYVNDEKIGFTDVLLGLMKIKNVDIYVTGSNSEMLSKNILTAFRGRSDQLNIRPLSYKEFYDAYLGDKTKACEEYMIYGGMPYVASLKDEADKSEHLKNLFFEIYIKDIMEREGVRNDELAIRDLLNIISSSIGSLTNPLKLSNTFKTLKKTSICATTIDKYLECFEDAFLVEKSKRYDVKGKRYIDSPFKYYFVDIGLRNAMLNFSQIEESHIMENILYNELRHRGFNVDVGVVELNYRDENEKSRRKQIEIDFVCNKGNDKIYIQSAYDLPSARKLDQEIRGLNGTKDSFKKLVIVRNNIVSRKDENGIRYVGIEEFLLNEKFMSEF